jgi:predicted dehydrogenase
MRIALFGLGGVAQRIHLPACKAIADAEIVGACEPVEERRKMMAAQHRIRVYPEPRTLLERERPELVIVGSPPDSHKELSLLALGAGSHVFCEKPFTETVADADEIIETARRTGRSIRVNNQYRYMPIYRETGERLARGEFGTPYFAQFWQQMFHPPAYEKDWRAALQRSTIFEFGTHAIDLACYFYGALPELVTAVTPKVPHRIDSDVLVVMTLHFADERLATFIFNRVSHAPMRYLETRLDCTEASLRISLGGLARASIQWSSERRRPTLRASLVGGGESRAERSGKSRAVVRSRQQMFAGATARHLQEFIAELNHGRIDLGPVIHSREVLRAALAAYESATIGATVSMKAGRYGSVGGAR